MAQNSLAAIEFLKKIIKGIEKRVKSQVKLRKEFMMLLSIPGIGDILGLTIMLEVGDIQRFAKVGDFPTARKRGRTTRKMATNIWPGLMWRRPTLLEDFV